MWFARGAVVAWLVLVVAVFGDAPLFMEGQPVDDAASRPSVHARKGVDYVASSTSASSITPSVAPSETSVVASTANVSTSVSSISPSVSTITSSSTTTTQRAKPSVPHKPTITIGVEEAPSVRPPPPKSSSSSIPPPALAVSVAPNVSASGMMAYVPVAIGVAAVPLLLFFAWQTVRRGKDAWRNRHYRRMDYLIEGMYNE